RCSFSLAERLSVVNGWSVSLA
uniref:Predicted gene, 17268 n=1 Tax=Peromyscus maniculatus bairdii TaxID=230844 RepID=A0A8C8VZI1_PERMB